jgi:septal ring factor EnvC (AmiA/AmiB activator)
MSRFGKCLLAALLLAALSAFAQDSSQPASTPPSTSMGSNAKHGDQAQHHLKRLSKRLNLTDDQKEKLLPILQDEERQTQSVEADSSLTPQQKHHKAREIHIASRTQMDTILTDEQKQKLAPIRHSGQNHHMHHGSAASGTAITPPDQSTPQ